MEVAGQSLGNTAAIARKSYVHPAVIDAYLEGTLGDAWDRPLPDRPPRGTGRLRAEEARVLRLLKPTAPPRRAAG